MWSVMSLLAANRSLQMLTGLRNMGNQGKMCINSIAILMFTKMNKYSNHEALPLRFQYMTIIEGVGN